MINEEMSDPSYTVYFSIKYETKYGQNLYILGSVPELGNWKKTVAKMKWTTGHVWRLEIKFSGDTRHFEYKFVIGENDLLQWETCHNRLFSRRHCDNYEDVHVDALWERFFVKFMIYYPLHNQEEYMQIMGGSLPIGNWFKNGGLPMKMNLGKPRDIYGVKGSFWEFRAEFDAKDNRNYDFEYRYSLYNTKTSILLFT
jgi:hypothetical protein